MFSRLFSPVSYQCPISVLSVFGVVPHSTASRDSINTVSNTKHWASIRLQLPSGRVYVMNLQANLNLISELLIYTLREEEKFQKCWPLVVQQKLSGKFQTHKTNFYPIKIWKRLDAIWTLHTSISFSGALSVAAWEAVNKTRFPDGKMLEDVCRLVLWKCLLCVE